MPQPVEMGPQPDPSMLTTEKAMRITYNKHNHGPFFPGELYKNELYKTSETAVYYPIFDGAYMAIPLVCADCFCEFQVLSREVVEVR